MPFTFLLRPDPETGLLGAFRRHREMRPLLDYYLSYKNSKKITDIEGHLTRVALEFIEFKK